MHPAWLLDVHVSNEPIRPYDLLSLDTVGIHTASMVDEEVPGTELEASVESFSDVHVYEGPDGCGHDSNLQRVPDECAGQVRFGSERPCDTAGTYVDSSGS